MIHGHYKKVATKAEGKNMDSKPKACTPAEHAASVFLLRNTPAYLKIYPPDVLARAEKCADPQGYLDCWLKLEKSKSDIQLLYGRFIEEHWEYLRRAGYTPKQLMDVVESGEKFENFERIIRDEFIEEVIPPKYRDSVRKLKREASLCRFPLDFFALADARSAVETAAKRLPPRQAGSASDFLPDPEGRINPAHFKWRNLPQAERTAIEASRDTALEKVFSLSPGARDEIISEFGGLQDGYSTPDYLKPSILEPWETDIRNAVAKGDLDFFVKFGESLKKGKHGWKKADASFIERFRRERLALFLIEHWLPSPRLRGTWLFEYLSNPQFFTEAGIRLSPRWLSSGALRFLLEPPLSTKRNKSPGFCFFSFGALTEICRFFLNQPISRSAIIKTIQRFGLKQCPQQELRFTRVVPCQNRKGTFFAQY
jgi:hypothetical protein